MKKIKIILLTIIAMFGVMLNANAASANVSVKASQSRIIVGNQVKVTVNINSTDSLGAYEYSLNYDSSIMKLVTSDVSLHYADAAKKENVKSISYSYTFRSLKSGSAKFSVSATSVIGWDESKMTVNNGSATVNVITQEQHNESLSKDNNLKSLSVEGYTLTPEFNKDTLEYSLELEPNTEYAKIITEKNDSKSSITGDGDKTLSVGMNKFEIIVTAQNGSKKTYVVNITVKEETPIIVNIDDKEYAVLRTLEGIKVPRTYVENTTLIDEEEVASLHNEVLNYTLLALKDSEGNIKLFLYENGTYINYNYLDFGTLSIRFLEPNKELEGYKKSTQVINDQTIDVLIKDESEFSLIYGVNLETGKESFYSFDNVEDTLQRYIDNTNNEYRVNDFVLLTIVFAVTSVILLITLISTVSKKKPKPLKEPKIVVKKEDKKPINKEEPKKNIEVKKEEVKDLPKEEPKHAKKEKPKSEREKMSDWLN